MSSIALQGNAGGAGAFVIASPSSANIRVATLPDATTTLVGTDATQTLTNKTIDASQLVAASVTSTQLATLVQPVGVGQTWQAPTRTYNTTYTNNTGRPIQVMICVSPASTNGWFQLVCGGIPVAFLGCSSGTASIVFATASFIVPDGTAYALNTYSGSTASIQYWSELR